MGALLGKNRDIWAVAYERGMADAAAIQRKALKLSLEGKLSGDQDNLPLSPQVMSATGANPGIAGEPPSPLLPAQPPLPPAAAPYNNYGQTNDSDSSSGDGSLAIPWASTVGLPSPSTVERFEAISSFVSSEWSAKEVREMKSHAKKLWKRYHKSKEAAIQAEELFELTRDSLLLLQQHVAQFIHLQYEEMRKHTQMCMINLLQRARMTNASAAAGLHPANLSGLSPPLTMERLSIGPSISNSGLSGSGASTLGFTTINVNDIDWLNEQVEQEKKNLTQVLTAQLDEWIMHAQDIAEAVHAKMDVERTGSVTKKQFVAGYGCAIADIVGPQFFEQHLPAHHAAIEL